MSQEYCILNLLNIEDKNIKLTENFYKIEDFDGIKYKVIAFVLCLTMLFTNAIPLSSSFVYGANTTNTTLQKYLYLYLLVEAITIDSLEYSILFPQMD